MENQGIEKALKDLAEALENKDCVEKIKITITLKNPNKANAKSK